MRELTVYDSQGVPLNAEGHGQVNERIKDFFFGGVRIALDTIGDGYKLTAFFRARESTASRSEQYYGVLETADAGELSNFREIIEDHMRNEYGKDLVTSKEDTTVFEELSDGSLRSAPGDRETRNDIADLVNEGERALVGVGSYEEATTLLTTYIQEIDRPKIAVAENAQSSTLSGYGLVIEKGSYSGLQLLGDTAERIEEMKERRRRQRQEMLGGPAGPGPYGQQQSTGLFGLDPPQVFAIGGGALLILLLVVGTYGACFVGMSIPIIDNPPLMDCENSASDGVGDGDNGVGEMTININATMLSTPSLHVEGELERDGQPVNGTTLENNQTPLTYIVTRHNNDTEIVNRTESINVADDGTFELEISENITETSHDVTVEWESASNTSTAQWQSESPDNTTTDSTTETQSTETTSEPQSLESPTVSTVVSSPLMGMVQST